LKRSPLARTTPLSRGDSTLKRTPLARSAMANATLQALRPSTPKRRPKLPGAVRQAALKRSRGRCIVCGERQRLQAHHVLPVREWPELTAVESNIVGLCAGCHDNHERAHRRIRWHELPECAITLAYSTSGAAAVFLERTYPR
jgi:5-methylcytosine-specific restriction endonuclease McrA